MASALIYQPPDWSTPPQPGQWKLSVMKGGVEISKEPLDTAVVIVGKQAGVCDITLDHASISRQHAAFQFGEGGELYICDLGSSNGTRVNKVAAQPRAYVALPVGSVIQFGGSTRLYIVEGPEAFLPPEVETPEIAALRVRSELRQLRKAAEKAERRSAVSAPSGSAPGASWGFNEELSDALALARSTESDDSERAAGRLPWLEALDLTVLTENEHTLHDRLQKRLLKVRNLTGEAKRITAKAGGADGLSAGQQAQLAKNEAAVEALLPLIEEDEEALRARLVARGIIQAPAGGARSLGITAHEVVVLADEDDVADTTERSAGGVPARGAAVPRVRLVKASQATAASQSTTAATQEAPSVSATARSQCALQAPRSLGASMTTETAAPQAARPADREARSLSSLQEDLVKVRARLLQLDAEDECAAEEHDDQAAEATSADALDSYMAETTKALHRQGATARQEERTELEAQLQKLEAVLAAVATALGSSAVDAAAVSAEDRTVGATAAGSKRRREPEKHALPAAQPAASAAAAAQSRGSEGVPRKPGSLPLRSAVAATLRAVMQEEVAVDKAADSRSSADRGRMSGSLKQQPTTRAPGPPGKIAQFDSEIPELTWVPPQGQTGDGRTALNDKLGY